VCSSDLFDAVWYADFYHHLIGDTVKGSDYAKLIKTAGFGGDGPLAMDFFAGALQATSPSKVVYNESHDEAGNGTGTHRTIHVAVNGAPLIGATRRFAEALPVRRRNDDSLGGRPDVPVRASPRFIFVCSHDRLPSPPPAPLPRQSSDLLSRRPCHHCSGLSRQNSPRSGLYCYCRIKPETGDAPFLDAVDNLLPNIRCNLVFLHRGYSSE
jgi:hypothetical protein